MKILVTLFCLLMPSLANAQSITGTIESIAAEYGNLETSLSHEDIETLSLEIGDHFTVAHGDQMITVYFGKTYEDVKKGEWISFLNWEKKLRIAKSFANAAETLDAKAGDDLTISKIAATE